MIQRHSTHTLNHTASSFCPQTGLEDTRAWSFSIWYYQLNHKWDSCITRSKISCSLIEPQPLPSTPAFGHEFHALAFHPHPTFTAPLVGSAFKIGLDVCCGVFLGDQSMCLGCWLFMQRSSIIDVWQLCLRFPQLELHQGNLELHQAPNSPDSHQTQIQ